MAKRKTIPAPQSDRFRRLKIGGAIFGILFVVSLFAPKSDRSATRAPATSVPTAVPQALALQAPAVNTARPQATVVIEPTDAPTDTDTPTATDRPSETPRPTNRPAPSTTTYYVISPQPINVRSEPSAASSLVTRLDPGAEVQVVGSIEGDNVNGSTQWYEADYNGQQAYVHSSLISRTRPNPAAQPAQQSIGTPVPADPFGCNQIDDLNCPDFTRLGINANAHLAQCGDEDGLDGEGDGRACEVR